MLIDPHIAFLFGHRTIFAASPLGFPQSPTGIFSSLTQLLALLISYLK
jgi:hypothetical protein